jgi:hypothetical protein
MLAPARAKRRLLWALSLIGSALQQRQNEGVTLEEEARIAASAEEGGSREPSGRGADAPSETPWSRPVIRRFGFERTLSSPSTTTSSNYH